jgi:hypothetical protein
VVGFDVFLIHLSGTPLVLAFKWYAAAHEVALHVNNTFWNCHFLGNPRIETQVKDI